MSASAPLTPAQFRDLHANDSAVRLLIGALIHGGLALIFVVLVGIAALVGAGDMLGGLQRVVHGRYPGTADAALVLVLVFLLIDGAALLLLRVGAQARELWTWLLALGVIAFDVWVLLTWGYLPGIVTIGLIVWGMLPLIQRRDTLRQNPVATKELRERMRGGRAFAVISIYLILMSGFTVILFWVNAPVTRGLATSVTGDLGRATFGGLVGLELALMMFIAPALTSGAVTGERERQTFDLLRITLMPRPTFLVGKLESALGFITLLVLAAIPLQSIAFLFGGVSEVELALSLVILAITAVTFGALGVFFSVQVQRTVTASIRAFGTAMGVMVGVPVASAVLGGLFNGVINGTGTGFTGSPIVETLLIYLGALVNSLSPFTAASSSQTLLLVQGEAGIFSATLNSTGASIPLASPWISFGVIYLLAAVVLLTLAVRRAHQPED
jgi:ABC-type transport system involved in multi-copper enzyme maturation permease subunit/uncharacterized protein YhhL (DUF1145 family)